MDAVHPGNPLRKSDGSYPSSDDDDDDYSESNSVHEEQSAEDTDTESEYEDEDADDDSPSLWAKVINQAVLSEKDKMKGSDGVVKSSKVIKAIKNAVNEHLTLADEIREDAVFLKIEATKDRLIDEGYDSDEAIDAAWDNRKYLVEKEIINPNQELLLSDSEEEEDDEMEDNPDVLPAPQGYAHP